ncbi:MAG: MarR family transcriptional regulator [Acidimicrobiales bacterium]|nr:MarR family transcriptional regulator [Acidimicrobiales bacterium]MCB9393730.1 MarR family transcriptional regulator [Acidimicrobiaceae bacterium]
MSPPSEPVDLGDPAQLDLAVRIGLAWIQIRRGAGMSALRDQLFGTGADALEQGQMDTLDLLAGRPCWRMSELAEALRVDPSTATRAVQRLVRDGLASRRASDDDGRVVNIAITPAGLARHAEVAERRGRVLAHLLGWYRPDERALLADMLERFVAAIDDFVTRTSADGEPPAGSDGPLR